jgi:hypothetical protein
MWKYWEEIIELTSDIMYYDNRISTEALLLDYLAWYKFVIESTWYNTTFIDNILLWLPVDNLFLYDDTISEKIVTLNHTYKLFTLFEFINNNFPLDDTYKILKSNLRIIPFLNNESIIAYETWELSAFYFDDLQEKYKEKLKKHLLNITTIVVNKNIKNYSNEKRNKIEELIRKSIQSF